MAHRSNARQTTARQQSTAHADARMQSGATASFVDQRESAAAHTQLKGMIDASPRHDNVRKLKQLMASNPADRAEPMQMAEEEEPLQGKLAGSMPTQLAMQDAPKENKTGLPDQLKSGIENLSGMRMDHVKVHYNSSQPAQLNAHAFAQGSDIHIAPGQEKHLPHEAWHVVQQAQGRVKPTMQMKGDVPVNDDAGLENEADVMGAKALQHSASDSKDYKGNSVSNTTGGAPVQRYSRKGEYLVSEGQQFAVRGHGTPGSQMFVRAPDKVTKLEHIDFEANGSKTIDEVEYTNIIPKYKSLEEKQKMEDMFCGKFSRHVTGKTETEVSGDAPQGRSLYINKLDGPATAWENHYAPVIMEDGGDRGTFETAVGLNYIFFGIYGQELEQSFAFKTEMAGIALGLTEDSYGKTLISQHQEALREGRPGYQEELDAHEREREFGIKILKALSSDEAKEKDEKERLSAEEALLKIREFRIQRDKEQKELEDRKAEMRRVEREEKARLEKEKKQKMMYGTLAILGLLGALLLIFLL